MRSWRAGGEGSGVRILAILCGGFSVGVLLGQWLAGTPWLLPLAGVLALLGGAALGMAWKRRRRRGVAALLALLGTALGLVWMGTFHTQVFGAAETMAGRTTRCSAVVTAWPKETDYGWAVQVKTETETGRALPALLYLDDQAAPLRPGDTIRSVVHWTLGSRAFSGEEIDYFIGRGIFLRGVGYGALEVTRAESIPPRLWPVWLSRRLNENIGAAFSPDIAPVVQAVVSGSRDKLGDQFTTALRRTGLAHTVAVSGMHLAFGASMLILLLGRGRKGTTVLVLLWAALFCGVAGNTPSVLRAALMLLLFQLAPLVRREPDSPTALSLALALLLLHNPYGIRSVSLQLSFAAVAGILWVTGPMQQTLLARLHLDRRPRKKALRPLFGLARGGVSVLSATAGASVLTIPLCALHFGSFSLISPLANLMTLWAVGLLFMGGMAVGFAGMIAPSLAAGLAGVVTPLARYVTWSVELLARPALAAFPLTSLYYRGWLVFAYGLLGLWLLCRRRCRPWVPLCAAAGTLAVCVAWNAAYFQTGGLTATVLDVGQGQSVLLQSGGALVLVDCGGDGPENAGDVAADAIQAQGRSALDLLVVSHYHADHANGVPQLLRRLDVEAVALPDVEADDPLRAEILELARAQGAQVWLIRSDDRVEFGKGNSLTLYAPLGTGGEANELCLAVLATAGDFDLLIPGDMPGETERLLLDHARLPRVEVLVAGHHGARTSTTEELLNAIRPETVLISAGANNRYGHPARATLDRLAAAGADIYRTDLQGNITVRTRTS